MAREEREKPIGQPDKSVSAIETGEVKAPGMDAISQSIAVSLSDRKQASREEFLRKLQKPHTKQERLRAIDQALKGGVPLHEIEELLDWLDQN